MVISMSAEALQLSGQAELSTPSLRRGARWFGVPVAKRRGPQRRCRQGADQLGAAHLGRSRMPR